MPYFILLGHYLLNSYFSSGNFLDEMQAGGSLALPIIHISAQFNVFKSNCSQMMAKIINNGEMWVAKLDVTADESI